MAAPMGVRRDPLFSSSVVNSATLGYARRFGGLIRAPVVSIPSNLIFLTGANPGTIVIGGGATTVAPSATPSQQIQFSLKLLF